MEFRRGRRLLGPGRGTPSGDAETLADGVRRCRSRPSRRRRQPYRRRAVREERAPTSPVAGIGKPRVAPEVLAEKARAQDESLKKAEFDVDLELFGDDPGALASPAVGWCGVMGQGSASGPAARGGFFVVGLRSTQEGGNSEVEAAE